MLPVCKLLFPNGSYRNGVCRALWALAYRQLIIYTLGPTIQLMTKHYIACTKKREIYEYVTQFGFSYVHISIIYSREKKIHPPINKYCESTLTL